MALVLADRVKETTTTTGTGTVTLAGASTGFQSFAVVGNGNTTYYCIAGQGTNEWEVGIGTYTSAGTTLSRTTVLASSNAGSLVTFSAGTKDVFVTYPAGRSVYADGTVLTATNSSILPATSGGTGQSSYAVGDLVYASTTTALSKLADVATGNALISGGVGVAPSYGKIGLTTHISGTLAVGNGGTGLTSLTANYIPYGAGTSAFASSANFTYNGSALSVTSSGQVSTLNITDTGASGTSIKLTGNGATTPNKYIRVFNGNFQVINSSYGASIFTLTDAGAISAATWNGATVGVAYGGTGLTTLTANYIPYGNGTSAFQSSANFTYNGSALRVQNVEASNGFVVTNMTVAASYTIPTGYSASSVGPVSVSSGATVTIPSGSRWLVL